MKKGNLKGDLLWALAIIIVSLLLLSPATNTYYMALSVGHPYLLGFMKFAVLATLGELLALRIAEKQWQKVKGLVAKMLVWGVIGMVITFMFKLFPIGIQGLMDKGMLPAFSGFVGKVITGLYNSIVANFAFGPIFMAAHRLSDTYIDMRSEGQAVTVKTAVEAVNWQSFIQVVVGKMIPFFWLPAHTVTFLLPEEYRILFAAYLSIVLGILLAVAKGANKQTDLDPEAV